MSTGNSKVDLILMIIATVLFAASEAIGKSNRFKASGVIHLLCQFVSAGAKGVLATSPGGILPTIVSKCEPMIETGIQQAVDAPEVSEARKLAAKVQEQNRTDPTVTVDHGAA